MSRLAIILAEFGRPAPDVTQFRETWPEADIQVCFAEGVALPHPVPVLQQFDGPRRGWRLNDYWKVRKLLDSGADIAISFDADMRILNRDDARTLPLLAERFGLCLPLNPRYLVRVDTEVGADSDGVLDETRGTGLAVNCSPIALSLNDEWPCRVAEAYCEIMLERPVRGPLAWWRACWQVGQAPYILPPQWCVCQEHIGCKDPIIIHEGHDAVRKHYAGVKSK